MLDSMSCAGCHSIRSNDERCDERCNCVPWNKEGPFVIHIFFFNTSYWTFFIGLARDPKHL